MIDRDTGWYFSPTSIKAVVRRGSSVLLCRNARNEWELPGGWPDRADETLEDTVRREVKEESGLEVEVGRLLTACLFRVTTEPVVLVVFEAFVIGDLEPENSFEHSAVQFFHLDALPGQLPRAYRDAILLGAGSGPRDTV